MVCSHRGVSHMVYGHRGVSCVVYSYRAAWSRRQMLVQDGALAVLPRARSLCICVHICL